MKNIVNDLAEMWTKKAMDRSRREFKRSIENVMAGAVVEFLKCRIHDKMGISHQDRAHWEKEWRYHLGEKLMSRFNFFFRFKDRSKACEEVLYETSRFMQQSMRRAANTMARYLESSPSKMFELLDEQNAADFMHEASLAVGRALELDKDI